MPDEPEAALMQRPNQSLIVAVVTKHSPCGIHSTAERGLGDNPAIPDGLEKFISHLFRRVILTISGQPFLLVSRGDWAWSRGGMQEQAIIAAARDAQAMTVESRDAAGRRFIDPYSLDGAATAIDAAAAACAGKIERR